MSRSLSNPNARGLATGFVSAAMLVGPAMGAGAAASNPDFSGMWGRNTFDFEVLPTGPSPVQNLYRLPSGASDPTRPVGDYHNPLLKPEAAAIVKQRSDAALKGEIFPDPSARCAPYPPPFVFAMQLGVQMLQKKDEIVFLYNQDDQVRYVRLNGTHPVHVTPSWKGDSVARYEGDTLVIDTVGVKSGPLAVSDRYGTPFSRALHVVERYRLIDGRQAKRAAELHEKSAGRLGGGVGPTATDPVYDKGLQLIFTVEDDGVFTMPWSASITYQKNDRPWQEQVCAENPVEISGKRTAIPEAEKPDF